MRGDRARAGPRRSARSRRCRSRTRRWTASRPGARRRDLTRRRLMQWGVAGSASIYARQGARLGAGLGVGRAAPPTRRDKCARAALPGRRQRRPERGPARTARRRLRGVRRLRGRSSIAARASTAAAVGAKPRRRGRRRAPRPARRVQDWRSRNSDARSATPRRQQRRRGLASTRSSATAPAAPARTSRSCPRSTPSKYSLSHFDNSDIWFEASNDLNTKTGWLGRWIDRNGIARQPAAGDLDRHGAVEVDPHRQQPGVRDPVAADGRLHAELAVELRRRRNTDTSTRTMRDARRRCRPAPATPTSPARAGPTGSPTARYERRPDARPRRPPTTDATRTRARSRRACDGRAPARRPTSARGSSRSTGAASTPTRTSSTTQDKQFKELSRALAAFQADLQGARDRRTASRRWCSRSSAAA